MNHLENTKDESINLFYNDVLHTIANFSNLTLHNILIVAANDPNIKFLKTFSDWKFKGYPVRSSQKGVQLKFYAPVKVNEMIIPKTKMMAFFSEKQVRGEYYTLHDEKDSIVDYKFLSSNLRKYLDEKNISTSEFQFEILNNIYANLFNIKHELIDFSGKEELVVMKDLELIKEIFDTTKTDFENEFNIIHNQKIELDDIHNILEEVMKSEEFLEGENQKYKQNFNQKILNFSTTKAITLNEKISIAQQKAQIKNLA